MNRAPETSEAPAPGTNDLPSNAAETADLTRRLTQRQLSMLAIGGAIGVGLFLGSSVTIRLAGPGVIVSYLLGAIIALIVSYSLVEMAVVHPVAGSFGVFAQTYLSSWAGFSIRTTYGLVQIIAIGAEVTAVGIYFAYWFPSVPQWIWVVGVSVGLVTLNMQQVGRFGEFEYWFALIKGVWLALTLALTSYMGVEIIAVTAGEAERPEVSIPRSMRTIVYRLILFYVLAITIMVAMTPWNLMGTGTDISGSPFVSTFSAVGIPYVASIMNLVVITAALSSSNTDLYLTTRMLFSLSRSQHAPEWLGRLSENGVPRNALVVSTGGMVVAILLAIYAPAKAFLLLYGIAVAGMLFVWIVILVTHLGFRRALGPERVAHLPLHVRFFPYSTWLGIIALVGIAASTFFVEGLQYSVPAFAFLLLLISLAYWRVRQGKVFASPLERS